MYNDLPRFAVVALVFIRKGDSILLVRQNYGQRYWSLPGGSMEPGESVDQAAVREVKEETGLDVRLTRLVGIYTKVQEGALAVCFEGEVIGGTLRETTNETSACRYFAAGHLPRPIREHLCERVDDWRRDVPGAIWRGQ